MVAAGRAESSERLMVGWAVGSGGNRMEEQMGSTEPASNRAIEQSSKQHVEASCTNFAHESDVARERQRERPRTTSCVEGQFKCKGCGKLGVLRNIWRGGDRAPFHGTAAKCYTTSWTLSTSMDVFALLLVLGIAPSGFFRHVHLHTALFLR